MLSIMKKLLLECSDGGILQPQGYSCTSVDSPWRKIWRGIPKAMPTCRKCHGPRYAIVSLLPYLELIGDGTQWKQRLIKGVMDAGAQLMRCCKCSPHGTDGAYF